MNSSPRSNNQFKNQSMAVSVARRVRMACIASLLLCLGWTHQAAAGDSTADAGSPAKPTKSGLWSSTNVTSYVGENLTRVKDGFLTFKVEAPTREVKTGAGADGTYSMMSGGGPTSVTRTYVYDANERLCKTINPESGATIIEYDAAGNILWTAEGTALTGPNCDRERVTGPMMVVRQYDEMNRVKAIVTPGAVADSTTTYTPDGLVESMTVANLWNGGAPVITTYAYNKRRLLESETSSQPNWYNLSVVYGYNANGHLSYVAYPYGMIVQHMPNALGQPTHLFSHGGTLASNISYYPNGAIKQFTYGNGIVHTMTPNSRGLPARSRDMNGPAAILDDSYAFDANGNVTDIIDQAQGTARGMAYDQLDRLKTAVSTGTPSAPMWGTAQYTYDALDNLRTSSLGLAGYTYGYDANNRLETLTRSGGGTYTYLTDQYGNVTSDGRQTYQWDTTKRLLAVADKEYYRYDGLGRRVLSWRPSGTGQISLFLYSKAGQVLHVEDGLRGQWTNNVYLGNTLLATRSVVYATGAEVIRYQHTDALGSPVAVTDPSRNVVERTVYAPYGAPVNRPVEGVGYTGHVMDQTTGLTYMQQRYYDPQGGRFLSVDPVSPDSSSGGNFNRYWYAKDNPYGFTDPDGRLPVFLIPAIIVGVGALLHSDPANAPAPGETPIRTSPGEAISVVLPPGPARMMGPLRAVVAAATANKSTRNSRDAAVNPKAPPALPTNRPVGGSASQNAEAQAKVAEWRNAGYTDIRVNQQQVNAQGERVGINRPDLQGTAPDGTRKCCEFDTTKSNRGPEHEARIRSNDANADVSLIRAD